MQHPMVRGLTIKAALTLGFGVTLAIWGITGYQIAGGIADVERQSSQVAARYVVAQDLLSAFRRQVLTISGATRDRLLDTESPDANDSGPERVHASLSEVHASVRAYVPVLASAAEHASLAGVREATERFTSSVTSALDRPGTTRGRGRVVFNTEILPRRDALLRASESLQAVNRAGFIQYQADRAAYHNRAERQRWERLGLALVLGLGIAILATVYTSGLERKLVTQLERDSRNTEALRHLSSKVINAQEEERARIGRELHDEVGQALSAIQVELALATRKIAAADGPSHLLQSAEEITNHALRTVRNLSHLLHPAALEDLGLLAAVDSYLRDFSKRSDVRTELEQSNLTGRLPHAIELTAYRVIQASVTNVQRHARAAKCRVQLHRTPTALEVIISDDGCGFDPTELNESPRRGLGLLGMRERVDQVGGLFDITTRLGRGTTVRVQLPITAEDAGAASEDLEGYADLRTQSANG